MARSIVPLLPLLLLQQSGHVHSLNNGVGLTPVMGWSSWMVDGQGDLWTGSPFNVTARALLETANNMVSLGLVDLGYNYILLDDGWPACAAGSTSCGAGARVGDCGCSNTPPRLDNGDVVVDPRKFPPSACVPTLPTLRFLP